MVMAFPKYESYKDSGLEWLGEIPEHWRIVKLKTISSVINGSTPDSSIPKYWDGSIVWITPSDLGKLDSIYISDSERKITIQGLNSCGTKICPKNSIVLSTRAPIGNAAITKISSSINQGCKIIVPDLKNVDSAFIYYLFYITKDYLNACGKGTTFKELSSNDLKSYQVVIPLLEEQKRIVDFLDRITSDIDQAIAKKQRLIELLNEQKAILINRAVTKGLNPNVPMRDSGIDAIGEIPEHWEKIRLKNLMKKMEQGWSPQCFAYQADIDQWGVLKVGCVNGYQFNSTENKILPPNLKPIVELEIQHEDILISRANTLELVGSAACALNPRKKLILCDKLYRIRVDKNKVIPQYFVLLLQTKIARQQIEAGANGASSSMQNIGQDVIKNLFVSVPKIDEQKEILNLISNFEIHSQATKMLIYKEIQALVEFKNSLISNTVTGKIKV